VPQILDDERPAVVLRVDDAWRDTPVLAELLAGLEEEGVPGRVDWVSAAMPEQGEPAAVALAHQAALASRLEVGLGLDRSGALALHQRRQPLEAPLMVVPARLVDRPTARAMGMNAARLVKVQPLEILGYAHGREGP